MSKQCKATSIFLQRWFNESALNKLFSKMNWLLVFVASSALFFGKCKTLVWLYYYSIHFAHLKYKHIRFAYGSCIWMRVCVYTGTIYPNDNGKTFCSL